MYDWFEIFSTGTHTDSAGVTKDWAEEELDAIAAGYNRDEDEAPIVIGHPETDDPAYGWIEALKQSGGKLYAKAKQVLPEFAALVREGRYKKISIALDANNRLRHVGFLGAAAPAVKGLAPVHFSAAAAVTVYEHDCPAESGEKQGEDKAEEAAPDERTVKFNDRETLKTNFEIENILEQAVSSGRLTPAQRSIFERHAELAREFSERETGAQFSNTATGRESFIKTTARFFTELIASLPAHRLFEESFRQPKKELSESGGKLDRAGKLIRSAATKKPTTYSYH